ncbi:hypothetical protein FQA39_LY18611 [Lamprigera yunnana]|nr:hypothetical protein FQA39_LY18611 [Lamprigera yunnana]
MLLFEGIKDSRIPPEQYRVKSYADCSRNRIVGEMSELMISERFRRKALNMKGAYFEVLSIWLTSVASNGLHGYYYADKQVDILCRSIDFCLPSGLLISQEHGRTVEEPSMYCCEGTQMMLIFMNCVIVGECFRKEMGMTYDGPRHFSDDTGDQTDVSDVSPGDYIFVILLLGIAFAQLYKNLHGLQEDASYGFSRNEVKDKLLGIRVVQGAIGWKVLYDFGYAGINAPNTMKPSNIDIAWAALTKHGKYCALLPIAGAFSLYMFRPRMEDVLGYSRIRINSDEPWQTLTTHDYNIPTSKYYRLIGECMECRSLLQQATGRTTLYWVKAGSGFNAAQIRSVRFDVHPLSAFNGNHVD